MADNKMKEMFQRMGGVSGKDYLRGKHVLNQTGCGMSADAAMAQCRAHEAKTKGQIQYENNIKPRNKLHVIERAHKPTILESRSALRKFDDSDDDLSDDDLALLDDDEIGTQYKEAIISRIKFEKTRTEETKSKIEILDERAAIDAIQCSDHAVVLFHSDDFDACCVMLGHLDHIAKKFPKTKFILVLAETAIFLAQKMKVQTLPSIVCVVNGKVVDKIVGLKDFGDCMDFKSDVVIRRLRLSGVIPDNHGMYRARAPRVNDLTLV